MSDEQLKILKKLENKEISVDEALLHLREIQEGDGSVAGEVKDALSQVLSEVGASLKEAGVAVNEVMTEVGNDLRSGDELQSALAGLLSGIRSLGAGKTFEFEHEGQFTAEAVRIELKGSNGSLTVQSWDKPGYLLRVRVGVRGQADSASRQYAEDSYKWSATHDSLVLEVKEGRQGVSVSGILYLPGTHSYGLDLETQNGAVRAQRLRGKQFVAETSNGAVTVEECDFGDTRIETSNGSVTVNGSCGNIRVRTSNGGIRVSNPASHAADGEVDLATSNGSINVSLSRDSAAGYRIDASTSNGRVRAELHGLNVRTTGKNQLQAESEGFPSAGSKVRINTRTSNGSINITHL